MLGSQGYIQNLSRIPEEYLSSLKESEENVRELKKLFSLVFLGDNFYQMHLEKWGKVTDKSGKCHQLL